MDVQSILFFKTNIQDQENIIRSDKSNEHEAFPSLPIEGSHLESFANSLDLPLSELIEAQKQGNLQETIETAQSVKARYNETCKKLDCLYEEVMGNLVTKDSQSNFQKEMTAEDLEAIKEVIKIAYKILARYPEGSGKIKQVIPVTKKYRIFVESSKNSFKVIGLFGKKIGAGDEGTVVHTVDLLEGRWAEKNEAVLKIPNFINFDEELIQKEKELLKKIHRDGLVLGIQRPVKLIKNLFSGTCKHCHIGRLYQTDLNEVILDQNKTEKLNLENLLSLSYQLIHALCHIHNKNITHGDINPKNIFCDLSNKQGVGPFLFLSDFGVSMDHQNGLTSKQAYIETKKKSDIYSTYYVICYLINGFPCQTTQEYFNEDLYRQLTEAGLSPKTAKLLIQGLDLDYEKIPDARMLLEAIKEDLVKISPEKLEALLNLSLPLL